ncbi:MAG: RNA methyltransferase [Bacteroidetes bacterium]|nr:RNA methyltransferase [Bacteroidota bacterium]
MVSKSELKYIQSLSDKKVRLETGCFIAEGVKLVGEMIAAGYPIRAIYALDSWDAPDTSIEVNRVEAFELEKMSLLQTPNQVVAVAKMPSKTDAINLTGKLTIVLDGIQDPGNLGTIIRIADWFGVQQIVASEDTVDVYNPKVIQATMGSFMRVSVAYKNIADWLPTLQLPVYGALLEGENIFTTKLPKQGILVIGSEAKGIRENCIDFITHPVTIPKIGGAESLNAGVATGIIVAQLTR